ncbi:MAG: DUF6273 domain-containing protein [Bacteroides sp.]|nr:DUF6273 domain-containing protein [Roseburia sp.]MCM1463484.1 DUF6273 domain-containing protein [Bacteroides sp.]
MKITRKVSEQVDFEHMRARINAGAVAEVVRPGDELEIPLENGETVIAVCAGYISDYRARFVLKDALGDHRMNDRPTNYGGYLKSEGRRHVLEDILPLFPAWLREAMKPRHMVEIIDGETHEYADTLWLPSATDVFGPRPWWNEEPDSEQLEIFKTERGRVKERDGETVRWWLRSPRAASASYFVGVYTDGTVSYNNADYSLAFAPGFDL